MSTIFYPSLRQATRQTAVGQSYVLLDSVRDAEFLSKSTTDALGNTIPDMGLGVVDNTLFFYTTKFTPGSPTKPRLYPLKLFWLGSPAGTTDANDNFSLFVADVNTAVFYPGAPASEWLTNPRLVLSWQQAKNDIVAWFDAHYPYTTTPPSNGVGQETPNGQSNTTYGTLSSGGNPGNVSVMQSIDGQFWPIYDFVDNSIILYFSFKTPNPNTKAVYCYKSTDTELGTPLTSTQFVGGVYQTQAAWLGITTFSSHRFSVISPDPLVTTAPVSGQQSAVYFYAYGVFDTTTPDHTRFLQAAVLPDIHTNPLNWNSPTTVTVYLGGGVDVSGQYNPDKLGSIFVVPQGHQNSACYALLYNATTDRDIRSGSNAVVIDAMQIRIAYYHPATQVIGFGDNINFASGVGVIGHCRPQYTTFPDGLPKLLYNSFAFDQSLTAVYQYIDPSVLRPENQRQIQIVEDGMPNPMFIPTFGKRRMVVDLMTGPISITNDPAQSIVAQVGPYRGDYDVSIGGNFLDNWDEGTLIEGTQTTVYSLAGNGPIRSSNVQTMLWFEAEDLPAYVYLLLKTPGSLNLGQIWGIIYLT